MKKEKEEWINNILAEIENRTETWSNIKKKDSGISLLTKYIYKLSKELEDDTKWASFKRQVELLVATIPEKDNFASSNFSSFNRQMSSFKEYIFKEFGYSDHKSIISSWWPLALIIYISIVGSLGVIFGNYPLFIIVGISFLLFLAPFTKLY
jgi:hypothetical protein